MADERIELEGDALAAAPRINMSRRAIIKGLACGTVVPIVGGCATLVTDAQLAPLAAEAWAELKTTTPQSSDPRLREVVDRNWTRIARATPKANEPWDVAVFDTDTVNAFVMPGNRVGVYRGMVEFVENEDQLSSVLGHEVGHSVRQHAAQRASQQQSVGALLALGQIAVASSERLRPYGGSIVALGGAAAQFGVLLPYSRAHESEADRLGVDYMHRAGYDVTQAPRLWELMDANSRGQRPPELMSTHPDPARRARELNTYIRQQGYI